MTTKIRCKSITASELVGQLSAVLDEVQAGCTFTVTRHGQPIASLSAVPDSSAEIVGASIAAEALGGYSTAAPARPAELPATALTRLLGGPSTRAVLAIFLVEPAIAVHQREVARRAGIGLRSAQIALTRLQELGLLSAERDGNRLYYRAVRTARFEDLRALMSRELGVAEVIARHLAELGKPIAWAFILGSAASGVDTLGSDIDLCVITEASHDELVGPIAEMQRELGREVDLMIYTPADFVRKRTEGSHFISSVLAEPRIDVIGNAHAL